jgi:hypothetical protein
MKTKEELLEELCIDQFKTLRFLNKIMFETAKAEMKLPHDKRNTDLLYITWGANDIITDQPRTYEIIELLEKEYGMNFRDK